jgi:hypothetical protein
MTHTLIVFAELASASGLSRDELEELVEYGVFTPEAPAQPWVFSEAALELARIAARLRSDFELAPASLALLLRYRERMLELQHQVRELECQLPRSRV